jgi:hypothetical protein
MPTDFNTETPTICGLQLLWREKADVVLEQYDDSDPSSDFKATIQSLSLGEYSKEQVEKFIRALSVKVDGYSGELTPNFLQEAKDIIATSLNG